MARGRMLAKKISVNKVVNCDLSSDTSRLLFSWAIAHQDREGRIHGDPGVFRSTVCPRLPHVTVEDVERYIGEWAAGGLVVWYECNGDKYLWFPKFRDNQSGMHVEREAPSDLPDPNSSSCRTIAGPTPDLLRSNSGPTPEKLPAMEVNVREGKAAPAATPPQESKPDTARAFVLSWFAEFSKRTARTLAPDAKDFKAGAEAWKRADPATMAAAVKRYFEHPFWFTEPRRGKAREYSFGNFLGHLTEIVSSLSDGPAPPKSAPRLDVRRCPNGHLYVHGQVCKECGWKEAKEADDDDEF